MNSQSLTISLTALLLLGLNSNSEGANVEPKQKPSFNIRIQQCREGCLEKFAIKEALCQQRPECSLSGFPPYNYNSLPDALHLLCWDECAKPPPPKINKTILETWALHTVAMHRKGSLVLVDVAWAPFNTPNQCLVTWEVSGGGLMGNLLTESTNVQLSLWPDTKYRVQVTCKNKITGAMSRSLPLTIDTTEANSSENQGVTSTSSLPSISSTIVIHSSNKTQPLQSPSSSSSSSSSLSIPPSTSSSQSSVKDAANGEHNAIISSSNTARTGTGTSNANSIEAHLNNDFDHLGWYESSNKNSNYNNNNNNGNGDDDDDDDDNDNDNDVTVDKVAISNSDIKILTMTALSRTQTPLIYGIVAGTFFLTVILFLYVCILRNRRISSDKKALIDDDGNATNNMLTAPSIMITGRCNGGAGGVGVGLSNNHISSGDGSGGDDVPIDPVMYSRTVHVLTV